MSQLPGESVARDGVHVTEALREPLEYGLGEGFALDEPEVLLEVIEVPGARQDHVGARRVATEPVRGLNDRARVFEREVQRALAIEPGGVDLSRSDQPVDDVAGPSNTG